VTWLLCIIYGGFALISGSNLLLMRRPGRRSNDGPSIAVLIPARDEEANLLRLIPQLLEPNPGLKVYVYDDDSSDRTAEVAANAGAIVIKGGPLPEGWTGKNYACNALGEAAAEDSDAEWLVFLDADVRPSTDFIPAMRGMAATVRPGVSVLSGFPHVLPGRYPEPIFLAWVGWLLLATNPFGFSARTGFGHNQFTNGQVTLWRSEVYTRLWPNRLVRSAVLEDVLIGRLLKKEKVGLEVANFASVLQVKMYDHWRQTVDGMSKNSYEITGTTWGTLAVAVMLFLWGWAWLFVPHWWLPFAILGASGLFTALAVRANILLTVFMPVALTLGAYTVLRLIYWRKAGQVRWKGRTY
jgi:hypothetical protein